MSRKACAVLASSVEIVINVHLTADHYNQFSKEPYRSPFPLQLMRLISSGIGLCLFGIRLTHHCSPHASHPFNSVSQWLIALAACDYCCFNFQNRDMEPQHRRVIHCNWRLVGFCRVEYTGYVSYPHLFSLSSHISGLCLRRFNIGEKIYKCSRSTNRCSRKFKQDRHDVQPHRERLRSPTYR